MMLQMIDMAKDLIAKGNALDDPELVAMGMSMLEKYQDAPIPDYAVVSTPAESAKYVCGSCEHEMEYDKPGRKKCPECKKHKLKLIEPAPVEMKSIRENLGNIDHLDDLIRGPETLDPHRATADDFVTQIRKPNQSRIRYDDNGQPVGMYTRTERIEGVTNVWQDEGEDRNDPENERLKKLTKVSPRTRRPPTMKKAVCDVCHTEHMVHPIHVSGRARYVCDRCVRRQRR